MDLKRRLRVTVMRRVLKIIMIVIMLLGIATSIFNFISIESHASAGGSGNDGTIVEDPDGGEDCLGAPLDCEKGTHVV
jgi:hypothetical protein